MTGCGVYIPASPALDALLRNPAGFRPDHAAFFLHSIVSKFYTGDVDRAGFARLDSRIIKNSVPSRAFSACKKFLVSAGVIETAGYSTGRFPTGYRIATAFDGPPRRWVVDDPLLAGKLRAFRERYKTAGGGSEVAAVIERRKALLDRQRESLARLSLPAAPAELVRMTPEAHPGHVLLIGKSIEHHDHDGLIVDAFGWRIHSIVTRTSSHLRPRLLLDGQPVAEVDVANSQPMLLAIMARIEEGNPSAPSPSNMWRAPFICGASPSYLGRAEIAAFRAACESGTLYDRLGEDCGFSRLDAKRQLFRDVLFGKPYVKGPITRAFGRRWPSLLAWIQDLKARHGYKCLAQALQRLESVIMLDGVGNRLLHELPALPFLTIHDSAMLTAGQAEAVRSIMVDEFSKWGAKPKISIKGATL